MCRFVTKARMQRSYIDASGNSFLKEEGMIKELTVGN